LHIARRLDLPREERPYCTPVPQFQMATAMTLPGCVKILDRDTFGPGMELWFPTIGISLASRREKKSFGRAGRGLWV